MGPTFRDNGTWKLDTETKNTTYNQISKPKDYLPNLFLKQQHKVYF